MGIGDLSLIQDNICLKKKKKQNIFGIALSLAVPTEKYVRITEKMTALFCNERGF